MRRGLAYLVFFLGAGCFSAVSGLKTDPGFTHRSLAADGIVVGGVTTAVDEPGTVGGSSRWRADELRSAVGTVRPDFRCATSGPDRQRRRPWDV